MVAQLDLGHPAESDVAAGAAELPSAALVSEFVVVIEHWFGFGGNGFVGEEDGEFGTGWDLFNLGELSFWDEMVEGNGKK